MGTEPARPSITAEFCIVEAALRRLGQALRCALPADASGDMNSVEEAALLFDSEVHDRGRRRRRRYSYAGMALSRMRSLFRLRCQAKEAQPLA